MKKLVLSIALVALLVAAVFGGQAIASSKSNDVSVSEEMSEEILFDWGSSYRGYPLRMKTLSGSDLIYQELFEIILDESYSGVRHVSLTLSVNGLLDSKDNVTIDLETGNGPDNIGHIADDGLYTYEFDTDNWKLEASAYGVSPIDVRYWATMTYPSNQW